MPASLLLFSRSDLTDLPLASFSCSHCFLLTPWLCSHCWHFCVFLHCLLVKLTPAYFLRFGLYLLLLLSPSLLPAFFLQDLLILLWEESIISPSWNIAHFFDLQLHGSDAPCFPAGFHEQMFDTAAAYSCLVGDSCCTAAWGTQQDLLPHLEVDCVLYSDVEGYRPSYGWVHAWHSIK